MEETVQNLVSEVIDVATGRKFDFTVFGATGFTGKFVVEELARVATTGESKRKWAIAGRNETKLRQVLHDAAENTGVNLSDVTILIADVSNEGSLLAMAKQTKVILNCVGPYRFYGEPVVKAAIEGGAHHVDVSGETIYLESVALKYNEAAKAKGVYIVGCCGWDSIPSEMGIEFARENFDGALNAIESVVDVTPGPKGFGLNFGTFHSLIYGIANRHELKPLRKELMNKPVPRSSHKLKPRGVLFYHEGANGWCLPFPGSDKAVHQRTQYFNYETHQWRPIQLQPYIKFSSIAMAIGTLIWSIFMGIMSSFAFGRSLLEKYPTIFSFGLFSHEGPTREQMKGTTFTTHIFGRGWLGKQLKAEEDPAEPPTDHIYCKVEGPDPGYLATSACLVAAARTILDEPHALPAGGGVLTPGAAFAKAKHLYDRLQKSGIKITKCS